MGNEFFARKGLALGTASQSFTDGQVLVLGTDGVVKYRTDLGLNTSGTSGTSGSSGSSGTRGTSGTSGTSFVGSGTTDYIPKWTNSTTLGNSVMLEDSSGRIGVGVGPYSTTKFAIQSDFTYGLGVSMTNANTIAAQIYSTVSGSGSNAAIQTFASGGTVKNVSIFAQASGPSGSSNYALQLFDGSQGVGKFLKSITSQGEANWANISLSDVSGAQGTITLTTTGTSGPSTFNGSVLNIPNYSSGTASSGTSGTSGSSGISGATGSTGTSGTRGTSGSSGTSGTQGRSSGVQYNFITSTTNSNPGVTNLKFLGSGTLSSVNTILISVIDVDNINQDLWLSTMDNGYLIMRSNSNTGTNFAVFTITSSTFVAGSPNNYYSLAVDINFTTGNWALASTDLLSLNFSRSGAGTSGTRGTSGSSGTSGTSGTRGTSGTSGNNGTSGTSGSSGLLSLTGTTNNGVITLNGTAPNGTVESNLTFDGTTLTVTGDIVATGNFTVSGTTSTVNTTNLLVEDPLILLASTQSGTPVLDSGIMINRGTGATQAFIWDESADEFAFISTNNPSTTYGNLTISGYSNLRAGGLTVSQIKIVDGTQGNGKYLISDANGIASWTASNALYEVHTGLNSTRRIGVGNTASGDYSATLAGSGNRSIGQYSVIVGGQDNYLSGWYSFIGGGQNNSNFSVDYLAIVGGQNNKAQAEYSFIGTGFSNTILLESLNSSIIAGQYNTASAANVHIIGSNIIGTYSDTAYVNKLNIGSFSSQSTVNILGVDSSGNVTVGSLSASQTLAQTLALGNSTGTQSMYISSSASKIEGYNGVSQHWYDATNFLGEYFQIENGTGASASFIRIYDDKSGAIRLENNNLWDLSSNDASRTIISMSGNTQILSENRDFAGNTFHVKSNTAVGSNGATTETRDMINDTSAIVSTYTDGAGTETHTLLQSYHNGGLKAGQIYVYNDKVNLKAEDNGVSFTNVELNYTDIVVSGTPSFGGMKYDRDYSPNYTNRSIVDKEYVDSVAGAGGTLAQTLVLGNETGNNDIELTIHPLSGDADGIIASTNSIDYAAFTFEERSAGNWSPIIKTLENDRTNMVIVDPNKTQLFNSRVGGLINRNSSLTIDDNSITLNSDDLATGDSVTLDVNTLGILVQSYNETFEGIKYDADYSANFTNRSLVDKEYVDSRSATSSGANNQIQLSNGTGGFKPYGFFSTASNNTVITNTASTSLIGFDNTFIGINSGWKTTGDSNTFIGSNSGYNNTGDFNTFLGWCTGYNNTTGVSNTFIGPAVGCSNTTGSSNIFIHGGNLNSTGTRNVYIGNSSGALGTASLENVFIGERAGQYNYASYNTFIGSCAGYSNYSGCGNTYVGHKSGLLASTYSFYDFINSTYLNSSPCRNIFIGNGSGYNGSGIQFNVFLGYQAGYNSKTTSIYSSLTDSYYTISSNCNVFIGTDTGYNNLYGRGNTYIGYCSGYSGTSIITFSGGFSSDIEQSASANTYVGHRTGFSNKIGTNNTYIGYDAGYSGTQSGNNTFIGFNSGCMNTANYNTFVGALSGAVNTTGTYNSFFGDGSGLCNTTGSCNTFIGMVSGCMNTTGGFNTFVGALSGINNTTGTKNTFIGNYSGCTTTTGSSNTFIGGYSGQLANATSNTFVGDCSGCAVSSGGYNTFIGQNSGSSITTGICNTIVGADAGPNTNLSCSISIGYNAAPQVNGQLAFGSVATASTAGTIVGYICTNVNGINYKVPYYNI